MKKATSRRQFTACIAGVTLAISLCQLRADSPAPALNHEYGDPLLEFSYRQVQLHPGPQQTQLEQTHRALMSMDEDSLLRPFRLAAGLPAPGSDMGGWYSAILGRVSGPTGPETFGQWLSALSRYYAATGDEPTRLKVQRLVDGYAQALEPEGRIFARGGNPSYHYDKLVSGLEDAHEFAAVGSALTTLAKTTDAALPHLAGRAIDPLSPDKDKSSEAYTIPENQLIAWERSGDPRYLEMAKQYMADDFFFEPLARGENVLARRHAYSHVNALASAAKAYLVLGDEKYLKAAVNGFDFVAKQSFATGGWGPGETFLPKPAVDYTDPITGEKMHYPEIDSLGESLLKEKNHFETPCGSYAQFKLTRYLLRITKDSRFGDSMERVMYNAALGALPINQYGKAFYQSNYHAHGTKAYFDGYDNAVEDEWPCCSGTLPQLAADYQISAYFRDSDGIYVNLFIPSQVAWKLDGADLTLTQSGQYPLTDSVILNVHASDPRSFALRIRIPSWTESATILVNGQAVKEPVGSGAFHSIARVWKEGDRVEMRLPRKLRLIPVDDKHPDLVAVAVGPLVLFALSEDTPKVTRKQLLNVRQKAPGGEEWKVNSANGAIRLVPWWAIKDETYFTYLQL